MDDVAAAAGISKGTIYLYFESKEALFEAAVEARLIATMNNIADLGHAFEGRTEDLLRMVFQLLFEQLFDRGGTVFMKVLISEGHRFPTLVQRYRDVALARGMAVIKAIMVRGVERGELHPRAADLDPRLVVGPAMFVAIIDSVFNSQETSERKALIDGFVDTLMDGIRAPISDSSRATR